MRIIFHLQILSSQTSQTVRLYASHGSWLIRMSNKTQLLKMNKYRRKQSCKWNS
jgi:hypothetical protein